MSDLKEIISLLTDKERIRSSGLCVVSSEKTLKEALESGYLVRYFFAAASFDSAVESEERFTVKENIIRKLTGVKSARGFAAAVYKKEKQHVPAAEDRHVLLDSIQDPANMGAIIRSGAAFGFDSFLLENCADPFLEKTIRASAGIVFKCNFYFDGLRQAETLIKKGAVLACTDVKSGKPPETLRIKKGLILALGNEGKGVSETVQSMAQLKVRIDYPGKVESLNVAAAAAILFYEADKNN